VNREVPADDPEAALPLHGPNQWPREELLPGFRATVVAYFQALTALGHKLLRLLALSLQLPGEVYCRALQGLHPRMPEELQYGSTAINTLHTVQYQGTWHI
jgi:isopenicillin N synthase-like dioxygenase